MSQQSGNEGYDDLLNAIESDNGYYLMCQNGHGSLPPCRVCSECGDDRLSKEPLPTTGVLVSYTEIRVPAPAFAGETPVVAIADFGPVRMTGRLEVDPKNVSIGLTVILGVATDTGGARHLAFVPQR